MSKGAKLVISAISVFAMWLLYWLTQPTLSLGYFGGFFFIGICVIIVAANLSMWFYDTNMEDYTIAPIGIAVALFIIVLLIGMIGSTPLFHATFMQQQLGEVETIEYSDMIKQIDNSQIPIVDEDLANKKADKKIGEDIALGSRVSLGNGAIQEVNGEIMYVIPLEHTGFFKWNTNRSTPGYITVSASNPNKVNFVTELNGEKINILYQDSAYFSYDLKRHIRKQGFTNVGLTEYTFEIDDTGRPYWVVTTYQNRTLWGSSEATGVVVVDAQTGETKWYTIGDTPDWVDIIQPKSFVENQIDNWGKLVHGVFNFSNQDKIQKTNRTLTVYVDGDCYYFTGMTSVGNDQACVGFIMVNTRTKKAQMCHMSGATEDAAMSSAEGLVSDFGYTSTEPLPLNVNGIPTYVVALKDKEGLIKSYAMVNLNDYNISAKGNSLAEASRAYVQAVARNSTTYVVSSDEAYGYTYEGKVKRISSVVEEGSTYYYIVVEGEEDKIFVASYMVSEKLSITRDGDTVKITYVDDKNGTVDIVGFDNIAFSIPISEEQEKRNELDEGTSVLEQESTNVTDVNPELNEETWDSLTEEEKAKLLEQLSNN